MSEHLALHPLEWRQASHSHSKHPREPGAQILKDKHDPEPTWNSGRAGMFSRTPCSGYPTCSMTHLALVAACPGYKHGMFASSLENCQPGFFMSPMYTRMGF